MNAADAGFCGVCGSAIQQPTAVTTGSVPVVQSFRAETNRAYNPTDPAPAYAPGPAADVSSAALEGGGGSRRKLIVAIVVVLALCSGLLGALIARTSGDDGSAQLASDDTRDRSEAARSLPSSTESVDQTTSESPPTIAMATTIPTATTTSTTSSTTITATIPVDSETAAEAELGRLVNADIPKVETIIGAWVPQLSAKKVGTSDDGITYDNRSMLRHFQALRRLFPATLLIWTGNYTSFSDGNFFGAVLGETFPTKEAANAWCDRSGADRDHCFAKRISHTEGPKGNSSSR